MMIFMTQHFIEKKKTNLKFQILLLYLWPQIIILQMLNIWLNVYILKCILAVCSTESECICILFVLQCVNIFCVFYSL